MRTFLRGKVTLLFMSLGMLLAFAGVAFADLVVPDADTVSPTTNQSSLALGTASPGQVFNKSVSFQLQCNGARHVDNGQTVNLSYSSGGSTIPTGGNLSATGTSIGSIPASWPDDATGSDNCPSPAPAPIADNGDSTATITAPKKAGSYTYVLMYAAALSPAGGQDSASITGNTQVTYTLTVPNVAPENVTLTGDTTATEGDTKNYTVSATDANEDSLTYGLVKDSGTADVQITDNGGGSFSVKFLTPGSVDLKASASDGTATSYTAPNISSVGNDGPVAEGASSVITVNATDADNDTLSYKFDCDNDGTFEVGPQASNSTSCSFGNDGSYTVKASVSDG